MLRAIDVFRAAKSLPVVSALSAALVVVTGAIDYLTGYELAFSIFYVVPVAIAAWYAGRGAGVAICVVSAMVWLLVDLGSGRPYAYPAIPFWNATVRFGFFLIIGNLLSRLHDALRMQATLARLDDLTGMPNGRNFRERCEIITRVATRLGHPLALCFIDLDGFKGINDSLGHAAGDRVLIAIANELTTRLRACDIVGRLGGDEFGVVLPETDLAGARIIVSELQSTLISLAERNRWPVGFSIGVAVFCPAPAALDEALERADELMYEAKRRGRNQLLFALNNGTPIDSTDLQTLRNPPRV